MPLVNVQGRFKVLDQPYSLPAKCAFCGLDHNMDGTVQFVDTTLDLDFYGVVYICSNCLTEISRSLGFIAPEAWEKIVESSTTTLIENESLRGENEGLRTAVSSLVNHRCYSSISEPPGVENAPGIKDDRTTSKPPLGGELKSPDTNEPDVKPGLSDVRGTTKLKQPVKPVVESADDPLAEFDV